MGLAAQLGIAKSEPRRFKPATGATSFGAMAAIFGEANPAEVTNTPRTVQNTPVKGEPITGRPLVIQNGWINRPSQTKGMSVLLVDQINRMPSAGLSTVSRSAINHSDYEPYNHQRNAFWMYANWDPIFRFANTAMDMRASVGHIAPLTTGAPGNIPGTARLGPFAAPYRAAYQVPRFSTTPNTIIPSPTR